MKQLGSYCFAVNGVGYPMLSDYTEYFPMSQLQAWLPWLGLFWERLLLAMVVLLGG
jgi:hypothetical protein